MIINYTGQNIIVNVDELHNVDHSAIKNYLPNDESIILADGQSAEILVSRKTNIYILTENCNYSGHFSLKLMTLPSDPIMYVGIRKGKNIQFSQSNLLPSDVDFGLARVLDQSSFWVMLLNPYYYTLLVFLIVVVIISLTCPVLVLMYRSYH